MGLALDDVRLGYDDVEIKVHEWAREHKNATEDMIGDFRTLAQAQADMVKEDTLWDEADRMTDAMKTPFEKYLDEIEKIEKLKGRIGAETYDRARAKAEKDYLGKGAKGEISGVMTPADFGQRIQEALLKGGKNDELTVLKGLHNDNDAAKIQRDKMITALNESRVATMA